MIPSLPAPYGALPHPRQLAWHRLETYGFIHFTTNTFTDKEWGYGDENPQVFNPSALDCRQWARAARAGGLKGLILTCKHHDGFCLWASQFTEHSVKNSLWRSGGGDVVRELADACREYGLQFGVYLSPWDRNHSLYGQPEYITYYRAQLRELLTHYGPIFEVWHDGANGGDGYYGGANETRKIDASTYYDWPATWQMTHQLQPQTVIFSDAGPDIRWVGNESGIGSETTWCTFNTSGRYPGHPHDPEQGCGNENGAFWMPPETDVSIRPGWFYHSQQDTAVKTPQQLVDIYFQSVGRGTSLLLNLPPNRRGLIHETDAAHLRDFRAILDRAFAKDLAQQAAIRASSTYNDHTPARNLLDDDPETCWAAADGVPSAELDLEFPQPVTFNIAQLQEYIPLGQRVRRWSLEALLPEGSWQLLAEGATIGYKRLARFAPCTSQQVRLRLIDCAACPLLTSVGLFYSPEVQPPDLI